jgi:hypothetical protein
VLNWRYGPLYPRDSCVSASRRGPRRVVEPCSPPESLAIWFAHPEHYFLFGAVLEALAKVVEEHVDVRVMKHDTVRSRVVVNKEMYECGCDRRDSSDSPELAIRCTADPRQVRERDVRGEHDDCCERETRRQALIRPFCSSAISRSS